MNTKALSLNRIFYYLILTAFIFSAAVVLVSAQDQAASADVGLEPDSQFYFIKIWKERIQTFLTFNAEKKINQYLHLSEVRLAEYQRMMEKGKTEIAEKTLEKYEAQLERALKKAEELKEKGKDISTLTDKLKEVAAKHVDILQQNLEKVPEQARLGLRRALDASQKLTTNRTMTITLSPQNNSGESGVAILKEVNGKTEVKLRLEGAAKDVTQPAHIHSGSCATLGGVKWSLTFPVNGKSETTLDISFDQLRAELPLAINVHKSAAEAKVYTSCGDLLF